MLNVLTKYSTMVTDGSTGSTSYVPMMPRAKGFCITTHKRTQKAGEQLCLLVYLRCNKRQLPSTSPPPCTLRAVDKTRSGKWLAQRKKICCTTRRAVFWWPFRSAVPHRRGAAGHQKICFIGMAIATTGIFTSHTHHRSPPHFPIWPHTHKGEAFPHTDPRQDPHPHIRTTYITHTPQTTTHRTPPLCPQREREREAKLGVPCQTSCCASTRNGMPFY